MTELNGLLAPVTKRAGPAARNAVPLADYLAPRIDSFGSFYANGASVTAHSDSVGRYARFAILVDPAALLDHPVASPDCGTGNALPQTWCYNAYPEAGDAADNQPFAGEYPHLMPYEPPSKQSVLP